MIVADEGQESIAPVRAQHSVAFEELVRVEAIVVEERGAVVMVETGLGGSTDAAKLQLQESSSLDPVQACDKSSQQLRPHRRLSRA